MIRSIMRFLPFVLAISAIAAAATIHVPTQQPTIQAGINAAVNNDTVLVAKGSYSEPSVAFNGKKIVLLSELGRDSTYILGSIVLRQTDILGPVMDGFTVSYSTPLVCFGGTNPTIKNCVFRDGITTGDGGGANVIVSSPVFVNCLFTNNHADGEGGAIKAIGASGAPPCNVSFINCDFIANSGGLLCGADIAASGYATLTFNSCFFQSDGESCGGSISSSDARINVQSCTFVDYSLYNIEILHTTDTGYFKIDRSLMSVGEGGLGFLINAPMDSVKVSRCIIYGYGWIVPDGTPSPGGYIYADPLFCDTASHDYRLSTTSPCASPHNPWGVLVGKYGTGCTLPWLCGDADGDGVLSVTDVVFIVNFIFTNGMYPSPPAAGDPDCTGDTNIADAVYLVSYIFWRICTLFRMSEREDAMKAFRATAVVITLLLLVLFAGSPVLAQQNHWDVRIQDTVKIGKVTVSTSPWPDSIGVPIYIWADDTLGAFSLALKSSDSRLQPVSYSNTGSVFQTVGSVWTDAVIDAPKNAIGFAWYDVQADWQLNPRGLLGTVYFRIDPTIPAGTIVNVDSAFIAPAIYCELTTVVSGFVHTVRPAPMVDLNAGNIEFAASYLCGDANDDAVVDIADAVYLINYIFKGGPAPSPPAAGDANCDTVVDIADAVYLISYIFKGGPIPCAGC